MNSSRGRTEMFHRTLLLWEIVGLEQQNPGPGRSRERLSYPFSPMVGTGSVLVPVSPQGWQGVPAGSEPLLSFQRFLNSEVSRIVQLRQKLLI